MKYFVVSLISTVLFIGICQAANPSKKCRDDYRASTLSESCILHCEYKAYGFANDNYDMKKKHIDNFVNALIDGNAVTNDKRQKLENLLRKCANEARKENPNFGCQTTIDYYRCIVRDQKLINYSKFATAIILHDRKINMN
uniref:14 kDa salivary protein n=1 Tax=Phlebotomus duboscqi TaxID=37738 RepID=Q06KA1_PHLDU|nr:14 kDa salivary protein [Phlebotomus duboscqi]